MTQPNRYKISNYLRGLFYALTLVFGLQVAFIELDNGRVGNFGRVGLIIAIVFLVEIYASRAYRNQYLVGAEAQVFDRLGSLSLWLHHLLLPGTLYICLMGFGYYNSQAHLRLPILILALVLFTFLFVNIRAHYEHRVALEEQTHFIYDLTKLVLFWVSSDVLINMGKFYNFPLGSLAAIGLLAWALLMLLVLRRGRLELTACAFSTILAAALTLILGLLWAYTDFNVTRLSLIAVVLFYTATGGLYHLMHKNLTWQVVLEYVLIVVALISILGTLS